jgi:alpha-D-ribose 1-methylphosphonate 5-triphosphate synthase subunit PhnG
LQAAADVRRFRAHPGSRIRFVQRLGAAGKPSERGLEMLTRTLIKLLVGTCALAAIVGQAHAHGAVATGGITDSSPYGSAYGISYGWGTKAKAEAKALQECERHRGKLGSPCQIAATFSRQWASVAIDPKGGTPGFGWAVESDKKTAEARAMFRCKSTSPEDRKPFCAVNATFEDRKP